MQRSFTAALPASRFTAAQPDASYTAVLAGAYTADGARLLDETGEAFILLETGDRILLDV